MKEEILMVAAEFKGLAKVGGLADVTNDLAVALMARGTAVRVLLPGYGAIPVQGAVTPLELPFGGAVFNAGLESRTVAGVPVDLLRCDDFFGPPDHTVYVDSAARGRGPFEDDARRFAFFSMAALTLLKASPLYAGVTTLHCHDWHTGLLLALARLTDCCPRLRQVGMVFTIHNLDYQGQRPLVQDHSGLFPSLRSWGPELFDRLLAAPGSEALRDPHDSGCFNPMRAAISLADEVNTVSPNYAREITLPDAPERAFVGGRKLESDLQRRQKAGTLTGILNGIDYDEHDSRKLFPPFGPEMANWQQAKLAHRKRLGRLLAELAEQGALPPRTIKVAAGLTADIPSPPPLAVSVSRLAHQKMSLLLEPVRGISVLGRLAELEATIIILGTGELAGAIGAEIEACQPHNLLLVPLFHSELAASLYAAADLFLMPSDFEPCGIGQLIAMRFGALPIVTAVGGLADTVTDDLTGFTFQAGTRPQLASAFLDRVSLALDRYQSSPQRFRSMQEKAMQQRFTWEAAARSYIALYDSARKRASGKRPT